MKRKRKRERESLLAVALLTFLVSRFSFSFSSVTLTERQQVIDAMCINVNVLACMFNQMMFLCMSVVCVYVCMLTDMCFYTERGEKEKEREENTDGQEKGRGNLRK